ncbi:hypothetical protein AYR66_11405 [Noviherbaspirillum denitrificans]|uniref:HTH lysR-type domain-containing protein n=2 Tax=Noviherbaspirillum denitrificans TaxID=1968433 RepID=A0A254TFB8_9BURK|nr:hypothetical protein AYR66_11405 [Noviherbaspirillum denitrificans]
MPLFERHPKGVVLTQAGEAFLGRAQRIRLEYDDALREMHQMKTGELGVLRLGFSPTLDDQRVMGTIRRMLVERPAARLHIVEKLMQYLLDMLIEGELDLVIAPIPSPPMPEIDVVPLHEDVLYVVADQAHPLHQRRDLKLADVAAEPWLLPAQNTRLRGQLETLVREAGLPALNIRVEINASSLSNFRLLSGTRMLGIGSTWTLERLRALGVLPLSISVPPLRRQIGLLTRKNAYLTPLAQRLRELLAAEMKPSKPKK